MRYPNILWLMTDEQRTDSLGCYGSPWARTPHLDALAAAGVRFDAAVTPSPMCGPARSSLLSGKYPHQTGIWNHRTPPVAYDDLLAQFHQAGYRSAGFGKMHHFRAGRQVFQTERETVLSEHVHYTRYAEGFDESAHGAIRYPGPTAWILGGRFPASCEQTQEWRIVDEALAWLKEGRCDAKDRPFFLKVSFNGPHTPVVPPAPYDTLIDSSLVHYPFWPEGDDVERPQWTELLMREYAGADRLSPKQILAARSYYYGYVAFIDSQIGRLLRGIEELGLLDDTIIAFVSDHGTHIGDCGLVQKQTFYEQVIRVPFLLAGPGVAGAGRSIATPVETRLLLPLLAALVGLPETREESPRKPVARGPNDVTTLRAAKELAEAVRAGTDPAPRPVFSEFVLNPLSLGHNGRLVMVRDGNLKLHLCLDPEPHDIWLGDLAADPYECRNRYGWPEYAEDASRLLRLALRHVVETAD